MRAWEPVIAAGYVPFAEWGDGWGPMCFDTERRAADGDCPIVWMDHEVLVPIGEERWRVRKKVLPLAQPLYDSCRELLIDVFASPARNTAEPSAGEPPRLPVWKRLIARFARLH